MKEIDNDYLEEVFLLNIDKNMPLCSGVTFNLQLFHTSFGSEPEY